MKKRKLKQGSSKLPRAPSLLVSSASRKDTDYPLIHAMSHDNWERLLSIGRKYFEIQTVHYLELPLLACGCANPSPLIRPQRKLFHEVLYRPLDRPFFVEAPLPLKLSDKVNAELREWLNTLPSPTFLQKARILWENLRVL